MNRKAVGVDCLGGALRSECWGGASPEPGGQKPPGRRSSRGKGPEAEAQQTDQGHRLGLRTGVPRGEVREVRRGRSPAA